MPFTRNGLALRVVHSSEVEALEFDAGVGGGELPVDLGVVLVAAGPPCGDFLGEGLLVSDASIEALAGEHAEFGFGHV
jgi:hypothetical protein